MDIDEIRRLLCNAVAEEFEIDKDMVTPDSSIMADSGLDSLDMVDLVVVIDRLFGVKLTREDLTGTKTFGDLADLVAARR